MEKLQRMLTFLLTRACPTLSSRFRERDWNIKPFPLVMQTNKKGAILQHLPAEYSWKRTSTNKIHLKQRRRWKTPFAVWPRLDEQLLLMLTCENQVRASWRGCEVNGSVYTQKACIFHISDGETVGVLSLSGCWTCGMAARRTRTTPWRCRGGFSLMLSFLFCFFPDVKVNFHPESTVLSCDSAARAAHSPASVTATRQPWIQV